MICGNCGKQTDENASVCKHCGIEMAKSKELIELRGQLKGLKKWRAQKIADWKEKNMKDSHKNTSNHKKIWWLKSHNDEKSKKKTKSFFEKITGFPNPKGGKSFYERLTQGASKEPLPPIGNRKWNAVYVLIIFGLVIYFGIFARTELLDGRKEGNTQEQATKPLVESREDLDAITSLTEEYEKKKAVTESEMNQLISEINKNPQSNNDYSENIVKCRKFKQLIAKHYEDAVEFSNNFSEIALTYFPSAEGVITSLDNAREDSMKAMDNLMDARIDYYQARLDKKSDAVINAKLSVIDNRINQLQEKMKVEDEAEAEYHNEFDSIFEN